MIHRNWPCQALAAKCDLRIAVASGPLVTGSVGCASKGRFERTYFGSAVGLAHDLASVAQPGHILVAEALADKLGADFQLEALDRTVQVRGAPESAGERVFYVSSELASRRAGPAIKSWATTAPDSRS